MIVRSLTPNRSISSQVSIRTSWVAQNSQLIEYAERNTWWPATQAPFDVARAYIDERVPRQISHIRQQRPQHRDRLGGDRCQQPRAIVLRYYSIRRDMIAL